MIFKTMRNNDFKFEKIAFVVKDLEKWAFFKGKLIFFLEDNLEILAFDPSVSQSPNFKISPVQKKMNL